MYSMSALIHKGGKFILGISVKIPMHVLVHGLASAYKVFVCSSIVLTSSNCRTSLEGGMFGLVAGSEVHIVLVTDG